MFVFSHATEWILESQLVAPDAAAGDSFGHGVGTDGTHIVIGAHHADHGCQGDAEAAYLFQRNGVEWVESQKFISPDGASGDILGYTVAIAPGVVASGAGDDDRQGMSDSGSAYVFNIDCTPVRVPGDLNCDGSVNNFDIDPFVLAITDMEAHFTLFPECQPANADVNGDGCINNFDIDAFVTLISGG